MQKKMLREIGGPGNIKNWVDKNIAAKKKITGFGHRVYKAYDPRARILEPLVEYLASEKSYVMNEFLTARVLEYQENSRIFRPRALYTGEFNKEYIPPYKR